jgi:hypothetical protein
MRSPNAFESHNATGIKQSANATLAQSHGALLTSTPRKAFPATITNGAQTIVPPSNAHCVIRIRRTPDRFGVCALLAVYA